MDYRVRAIHQDTGVELFNVSYSHLSLLNSSLRLPTFGDTPAIDQGKEATRLGISLDPGTKNAIQRIDDETGRQLWSISFEQPPVTVFAGGEIGKCLYGEPTWPAAESLVSRSGLLGQGLYSTEILGGNALSPEALRLKQHISM